VPLDDLSTCARARATLSCTLGAGAGARRKRFLADMCALGRSSGATGAGATARLTTRAMRVRDAMTMPPLTHSVPGATEPMGVQPVCFEHSEKVVLLVHVSQVPT